MSKYDRKIISYPDPPKAYQVSQYDQPICRTGYLEIEAEEGKKRIGINRVHIEEDAGKLIHQGAIPPLRIHWLTLTLRGAAAEIVSEPDREPREACLYLRITLSAIIFRGFRLQDGGRFPRCDANISIRPRGETRLGTKAEIKNMNSFRSLERALEYELTRQMEVLEDGGRGGSKPEPGTKANRLHSLCGRKKRPMIIVISPT